MFLVMILALTGSLASAAMTSGSFLIKSNSLAGACVPGGQSESASFAMTGAWGGMIGSSSASYQLDAGCVFVQTADTIPIPTPDPTPVPSPTPDPDPDEDYTIFLPLILR